MKTISVYLLILVTLFVSERSSFSKTVTEPLKEVKNGKLTHLLNDLEILAEYHEKDSPYRVRVIRLGEHGECERPFTDCLSRVLYISVSSYDEDPDERLFLLPKAYMWEFVKWINVNVEENPDEYLTFEIKKISPPSLMPARSLKEEFFEIGVNPIKGYMKIK